MLKKTYDSPTGSKKVDDMFIHLDTIATRVLTDRQIDRDRQTRLVKQYRAVRAMHADARQQSVFRILHYGLDACTLRNHNSVLLIS